MSISLVKKMFCQNLSAKLRVLLLICNNKSINNLKAAGKSKGYLNSVPRQVKMKCPHANRRELTGKGQ
jgi:hypothetical protein